MNSFFKKNKKQSTFAKPEPFIFWNFSLDKNRLKNFVSWFLKKYGEKKTIQLLEQLKNLGFGYATEAGISLGIEDLKIPPKKSELLAKAEFKIAESKFQFRKGQTTDIERLQQFVETWHETSENLKTEVVRHFEKTDILNPVYMMAFSGARGNLSQVRQLVGMRGLMSDPQGKIIDFPIQSNFREGLTLTEYLISTYGARKGIVDTALRTATAGYLTRRLVDVAQHVIVSKFDCGTQRGIFLFDMKEGVKTIYSFQNRLIGRVLAQDIRNVAFADLKNNNSNSIIAFRNQEIDANLANLIAKITKRALVRSPLTCETRKLVCQLCYGWSLATSKLVSIGEAVGVIAGQSIGEPGTQLTMRTFHTGGVFSANISEQIHAPFDGLVEYAEPIAGACARLPDGNLAFLTKTKGTLFFKQLNSNSIDLKTEKVEEKKSIEVEKPIMNTYALPAFTILFGRHGQVIKKETLLAQVSALPTGQKGTQIIEQTVYASFEGEVYYDHIDLLEDIDEKYGERVSTAEDWAKIWVLSGKIYKNPLSSNFFPNIGDFISKNSILNEIQWKTDIAQNSYLNSNFYLKKRFKNLEYPNQLSKNLLFPLVTKTGIEFSKKFDKQPKKLMSSFHFSGKLPNSMQKNSEIYISGKYKIQKKFFLHPKKFLTIKDLSEKILFQYNTRLTSNPFLKFKQLKSNSTLILLKNEKKLYFSKNFIQILRNFKYPYNTNLRSSLSQILSQTFVVLPVLQPGVLKIWLQKNPKLKQRSVSKQTLNKKIEIKSTVKKLNQTQKFQRDQKKFTTKLNYLHPLILSNTVPFYLKTKTLKNALSFKNIYIQNFFENSILAPYQTKFFEKSPTKNRLTLTFNPKDFYLYQKLNSKKFFNQVINPEIQIRNENNFKFLNKWSKHKLKEKNQKFEKFAYMNIETPILSIKPTKVFYKKLGYFISFVNSQNGVDQLFSFLPLQTQSFQDRTKELVLKDLTKNPQILQSPKFAQNSLNSLSTNFIGLKNSDQWNPLPLNSFYWFPESGKIPNSGILFLKSPLVLQNRFQKNLEVVKSKSQKTPIVYMKNNLNYLNLAQSQIFKKSASHFSKLKIQQEQQMRYTFSSRPSLFHNLNLNSKKRKFLKIKNKSCISNQEKYKNPISANSNLFLKCLKKSKTEILTKLKIGFLQKSRYKSSKIESTLLDLKNLDSLNPSIPIDINFSKNLEIKLNSSEKASTSFYEISWIPQENLIVHSYSKWHFPTQRIHFYSNGKMLNNRQNSSINGYLRNAQGTLKKINGQKEGIVSIQKQKSKPISFHSTQFHVSQSLFKNTNYSKKQFLQYSKISNEYIQNKKSRFYNPSFEKIKRMSSSRFFRFATYKFLKQSSHVVLSKNQKNEMNSIFKANRKSRFFSFIPLLKKNRQDKMSEFRENFRPKEKLQKMDSSYYNVQIKPGWVYQTKNFSNLVEFEKTLINNGQKVVDAIIFEQQPVLLELLSIKKENSTTSKTYDISQFSSPTGLFEKSSSVYNTKARFFKVSNNQNFKIDSKLKNSKNSILFLIRPVYQKMLPNLQEMKTNLYRSMRKSQFQTSQLSFLFYEKYFSQEFNKQKGMLKMISQFPPIDFVLNYNSLSSFLENSNKFPLQDKEFYNFTVKKRMSSGKKVSQKSFRGRTTSLKLSISNLQFFQLFYFRNQTLKKGPHQTNFLKQNLHKLNQQIQCLRNHQIYFYFSNNSANFGQVKVSLNLSKINFLDCSFPSLFLNLNKNNFSFLTSFSKKFQTVFQDSYFRFLLNRNSNKISLLNLRLANKKHRVYSKKQLSPSFSKIEFAESSFSQQNASKFKLQKCLFSKNISFFFPMLNSFEYSLSQKYNFLANQRLFASMFYKKQFDMVLNMNRVDINKWSKQESLNQRFFTKTDLNNGCSDSYYSTPISKNYLIFKNGKLKFDLPFACTRFYSFFEGEVLKDYQSFEDLNTLAKNPNIHLETGILVERQSQKLFLTYSDIFSIKLPLKSMLVKKEQDKHKSENFLKQSQILNSVKTTNQKSFYFEDSFIQSAFHSLLNFHQMFQEFEQKYYTEFDFKNYDILDFQTTYEDKKYQFKKLNFGLLPPSQKLRLKTFLKPGSKLYSTLTIPYSGQIIHLNSTELILRRAEFYSVSPRTILHTYNGQTINKNAPVMTLPFETLKTGDIVQGIPKVEQYLEARTTIRGRLFLNSLPVLLYAIFQRYASQLPLEKAVRQSFLKIQQILVDGVQRVYRTQGVSLADKHLEIIVRQMTYKVKVVHGGQTGFFAGELVDLEFVERINRFLMVKIQYEPVVLGITRASLEVDSFLSAASFQQTTKVLTRAALENKRDFLKGLKENLLVGNLLPAGTGYVVPLSF